MKSLFENVPMPITSASNGKTEQVAEGVSSLCVQIVNVCFITTGQEWVLIDAGMTGSEGKIIAEAERLYGAGKPPKTIVLTHGHFDHIGSLSKLLAVWDVPVYAHRNELPYLTGQAEYPPGDPTVDGGLISELSPMFPHDGLDLGNHVHPLPTEGPLPWLPGWTAIPTPGHSPGHVSLWRESDRTLLAGDAFVTVKQESLYKVLTQEVELNGPPKYMTPDWPNAKASVETLARLAPETAVTGHGHAMRGDLLRSELNRLAANFDEFAIPKQGSFV